MFPGIRDPGGDPKMEALRRLLLQQAGIPELAPPSLRTQDPTRGGLLADPLAGLRTPIVAAQEALTPLLTPEPPEPQTMPLPNTEAYRDVFRRRLAGETFEPQGPVEAAPPMDPAESLAFLQDRAEPTPAVSGEEVPSRPAGGLGAVQGPGDVERLLAEQKIAKLTAFRDIAEGLGRPIPIRGAPPPEPYRAEGIRGAIRGEGVKLADLAIEDKMRLQSQLRREEAVAQPGDVFAELQEKARKTLNDAAKQMESPSAKLRKIRDSIDDSVQINDLLTTGDVSETAFQQALTLLIKSMGREVGNIAERERRQYADIVGVPGMFRKGYRWAFGGPSPGQIASLQKVASIMTENLREAGDKETDRSVGSLWKRNRSVFENAGLTKDDVLEQLGLDVGFGGGDVDVDGGAGRVQFRHPETGETDWAPEDRADEAAAGGWVRVDANL